MSGEDRRHRRHPGETRVDDRDVDAVARGAEQIPAEAEGSDASGMMYCPWISRNVR